MVAAVLEAGSEKAAARRLGLSHSTTAWTALEGPVRPTSPSSSGPAVAVSPRTSSWMAGRREPRARTQRSLLTRIVGSASPIRTSGRRGVTAASTRENSLDRYEPFRIICRMIEVARQRASRTAEPSPMGPRPARRGRPRSDRLHRAILGAFREVRCNWVGATGVSRA